MLVKNEQYHPNCQRITQLLMRRFFNYTLFFLLLLFIEHIGSYDSLLLHCAPPLPALIHISNFKYLREKNDLLQVFKKSSVLCRNRPITTKYAKRKLPLKRPETYKNPYPHCLTPPPSTLIHILTFHNNIIKIKYPHRPFL